MNCKNATSQTVIFSSVCCVIGGGWEIIFREGAHALWPPVYVRWGHAHQTAHTTQWSGLEIKLHHKVLVPRAGGPPQKDKVLHRTLQERSTGVFLYKGQRAVLHTGHEEQDGTSEVTVWSELRCSCVDVCFDVLLFCRRITSSVELRMMSMEMLGSLASLNWWMEACTRVRTHYMM